MLTTKIKMIGFDRLLFRRATSTGKEALLAFLFGGILFWGTGAAVKIYFMHLGSTTYPWTAFLSPESLPLTFFVGALFSLPHYVLIHIGYGLVKDRHGKRMNQMETEIVWALRGGCLAIIIIGVNIFQYYDPVYIFGMPVIWLIIALFMGGGMLGAWLITKMANLWV